MGVRISPIKLENHWRFEIRPSLVCPPCSPSIIYFPSHPSCVFLHPLTMITALDGVQGVLSIFRQHCFSAPVSFCAECWRTDACLFCEVAQVQTSRRRASSRMKVNTHSLRCFAYFSILMNSGCLSQSDWSNLKSEHYGFLLYW